MNHLVKKIRYTASIKVIYETKPVVGVAEIDVLEVGKWSGNFTWNLWI